jgi:hypothetical protein
MKLSMKNPTAIISHGCSQNLPEGHARDPSVHATLLLERTRQTPQTPRGGAVPGTSADQHAAAALMPCLDRPSPNQQVPAGLGRTPFGSL